ncbi:MAG: hypothetical protein LKKZDAJK_002645 [Candidatus Fervidibacter sp.]
MGRQVRYVLGRQIGHAASPSAAPFGARAEKGSSEHSEKHLMRAASEGEDGQVTGLLC